jgi:hypothetical protein
MAVHTEDIMFMIRSAFQPRTTMFLIHSLLVKDTLQHPVLRLLNKRQNRSKNVGPALQKSRVHYAQEYRALMVPVQSSGLPGSGV